MLTINNLEEMAKYYNEATDTYIFVENGKLAHIELCFDLSIESNIEAMNIIAVNNNAAEDIKARHIKARDIKAEMIISGDIISEDITAREIYASDIDADFITAGNITVAGDINALNIAAGDIKAQDIDYDGVCFAYDSIDCTSIKGRRENSKHFCLDGELTIRGREQDIMSNPKIPKGYSGTYLQNANGSDTLVMVSRTTSLTDNEKEQDSKAAKLEEDEL